MPLLGPEYGNMVGDQRDLSEIIDESEIKTKRLILRPFLDFNDEYEQLQEVVLNERTQDIGVEKELKEDYIVRTYKLSKRKEHAFIGERLSDDNIRIFCGDIHPDNVDALAR